MGSTVRIAQVTETERTIKQLNVIRIVAILDEAFATATANAEKNLANARELFESELNRVFTQKGDGWVDKRLGEACRFPQGIQVAVNSQSKRKRHKHQVRFLRIVDFTQRDEAQTTHRQPRTQIHRRRN